MSVGVVCLLVQYSRLSYTVQTHALEDEFPKLLKLYRDATTRLELHLHLAPVAAIGAASVSASSVGSSNSVLDDREALAHSLWLVQGSLARLPACFEQFQGQYLSRALARLLDAVHMVRTSTRTLCASLAFSSLLLSSFLFSSSRSTRRRTRLRLSA